MTTVADTTIAGAVNVCSEMFSSIDTRNWDVFEHCLADTVTTDFSGLWGGEPELHAAPALRESWAKLFTGFQATQHLVTNYVGHTTIAGAELRAAFRASHIGHDPFGSPVWTLYGTYRIELVHEDGRWQVAGLHQSPQWGEGNRNIVLLAVQALG
ncbi:MAG: hypothetical protein DLM61_21055 [Pseudonocardiales bacterium]|nr:MAG: hypothetical protein DLM61_21055 [Pseudonocardiales bacterium]